MAVEELFVVFGGELAADVAERVLSKKPPGSVVNVTLRNASDKPQKLVEHGENTCICFVIQTVENEAPAEDAGVCVRFFKRKTHPESLLTGKFSYTVLGLGDSNLLLDRQTTTAKDCNRCAQELDARLEALGAQRLYPMGIADERTGLEEVETWVEGLWARLEA